MRRSLFTLSLLLLLPVFALAQTPQATPPPPAPHAREHFQSRLSKHFQTDCE